MTDITSYKQNAKLQEEVVDFFFFNEQIKGTRQKTITEIKKVILHKKITRKNADNIRMFFKKLYF